MSSQSTAEKSSSSQSASGTSSGQWSMPHRGLSRVARQLEWTAKSLFMSSRALLRWGTAWPRRVQPEGCEIAIAINPQDRRARKRLIYDTIKRKLPRNRTFWSQACMNLRPDTALDIGTNYGECLFAPRYHESTRVFGFEANPELHPYLIESLASHPDKDRISLLCGLVSHRHGGNDAFHIDTHWSGMSGGVQAVNEPQRYRTLRVPAISVDGVLADAGFEPKSLLFKIDVEGFEPKVLAGMKRTLGSVQSCVGFIELDQMSAEAANVDLRSFFVSLKKRFHVHGFTRDDKLIDLQHQPFSILDGIARKQRLAGGPGPLYTDLVLLGGEITQPMRDLVAAWR